MVPPCASGCPTPSLARACGLKQGTYAGDYVLSADGEPTRPIFLDAPQGATFTGCVEISGNWTGIGGVTFRGNGRKVDISGTGGRVMRCTSTMSSMTAASI